MDQFSATDLRNGPGSARHLVIDGQRTGAFRRRDRSAMLAEAVLSLACDGMSAGRIPGLPRHDCA